MVGVCQSFVCWVTLMSGQILKFDAGESSIRYLLRFGKALPRTSTKFVCSVWIPALPLRTRQDRFAVPKNSSGSAFTKFRRAKLTCWSISDSTLVAPGQTTQPCKAEGQLLSRDSYRHQTTPAKLNTNERTLELPHDSRLLRPEPPGRLYVGQDSRKRRGFVVFVEIDVELDFDQRIAADQMILLSPPALGLFVSWLSGGSYRQRAFIRSPREWIRIGCSLKCSTHFWLRPGCLAPYFLACRNGVCFVFEQQVLRLLDFGLEAKPGTPFSTRNLALFLIPPNSGQKTSCPVDWLSRLPFVFHFLWFGAIFENCQDCF